MTATLGIDSQGDPGAPVVVLLSSLGTTRDMWEPQLPAFAERFRVVRVEHRGHGASDAPPGPYRIGDLGRDVLACLDSVGVRTFSLLGVSLGAMVGIWLAACRPERVERLALCCTSAYLPPAQLWRERASMVREGGMASVSAAVVERWFTPAWSREHPEEVAAYRDDLERKVSPEGYAGCCEAIAAMDLRPLLGSVTTPTLVLAGADDVATPVEHAESIAAGIKDPRVVVVPAAAHLATVERADVCTPLLIEHLGGAA